MAYLFRSISTITKKTVYVYGFFFLLIDWLRRWAAWGLVSATGQHPPQALASVVMLFMFACLNCLRVWYAEATHMLQGAAETLRPGYAAE
jgi:hypothetical protein